jgi:radical SAM superfamily enzyme YgiQ (UPF0313 family)
MPPYGVAYVASILKKTGVDSILHDDNLYRCNNYQLREIFRKYKGEVRAVGLTSVSTTLMQLSRVAKISKEELPDVPVMVGGPHARLLPDEIIGHPAVDIVFTGEAELPILEYASGKDPKQINGIFFKNNGNIVRNPQAICVKILDEVPFPDYDLFDISEYHSTRGIAKRHPVSYVITSRGCPYNCTFCSSKALNPAERKRVRFRSPENVLEEIEFLVKRHGVKELFFSDDMFTGNTSHLIGVCEGLIDRKFDLSWVCMTHVNNITEEKLRVMKRAGCHQICYGVESGDPQIQKIINKNLNLEKVRIVVRMTQDAGIEARCSFMFGNQYETPETMQRTIDYARSLRPDFASFNIATPYPGTYLRSWAIENGYLANPSYEALDSSTYPLVTPGLPAGTVEKYVNKAFRSFYYRPNYILGRLSRIRDVGELRRVAESAYYALKSVPSVVGGIRSSAKPQ